MVKVVQNYDELENGPLSYSLNAITKFKSVRKKAIRNKVAYPSSDLTPQYKLEFILDEEKSSNWEQKLCAPLSSKRYKKKFFFVARAYFLDFFRFFMIRGAKSTLSSSLIFLQTPDFSLLKSLSQLFLKKKIVTKALPIWVSEKVSAFRTEGTRRASIEIPPQKKSSDPLYTLYERKATGSFSETLHLKEDNSYYDLISESFRNFYLGDLFQKYKTVWVEIPRLLALKSTRDIGFKKLDKKPFSKRKKTGRLLVKNLFSYYSLFFVKKKTSCWAAITSLLKTKNLRAFRIDLKFGRIFDKDLKNYQKGSRRTHKFKVSPFVLTRFYSGRRKAKLRKIGLIGAYKKNYDLLFQGNRNFLYIGEPSKTALLFFTRRGLTRKANRIPRDLGAYYKEATYYMNQCLVRYQIRMHRNVRFEPISRIFRGRLYFIQPWVLQHNPSLVLYAAVVSLESKKLALKKLFRRNTCLFNSFSFFFAGKKRLELFLNYYFYPKKKFFWKNYKVPLYNKSKLVRRFRNWAPKRSSRLGYRTLSRKGTTQLLILDYINFKKKIFKHEEPTRIFIRHHSKINKGWGFRDFILAEGSLFDSNFLSKITTVFLHKNCGNYKPSFRFQKWKKPLNHRINQLTINLNGESLTHFAATSDYKTLKKSLGKKRPAVKEGLLPFNLKVVYPYNNKKRTKKPAIKVNSANLSQAGSYLDMFYNSIVEEGLKKPQGIVTLHTLHNNPGFREYKPTNFRLNFFKKTYHIIDFFFPQEQLKNISSIFANYSQAVFFFKSFFLADILTNRSPKLECFCFGFLSKELLSKKKNLKNHPKLLKFRKEPRTYRKAKNLVALRPFGLDIPEPATLTANWEDYENFHSSKFVGIRDKDGNLTRDTHARIRFLGLTAKKLILNARP